MSGAIIILGGCFVFGCCIMADAIRDFAREIKRHNDIKISQIPKDYRP